jgi:sec-independent protein translocase protein TatB
MFPLEQGAFEMLLIGAIALIVVGPKDLPVLMRKIGQFTAKMRGMANEFRASFEEMARQSELDELRREVEALRTGQPTSPVGVTGPTVAAQPAIGETEPLASGSSFVSPPHAAPVALSAAASSSPDEPAPSRAAAQGEGGPHDAVVLTAAALAAEPVSEGASGPATGPALGSAAPAVSQTAPKTRSKAARSASDLAAAAQAPAPPGGAKKPRAPRARAEPAQGEPR